MSYLINVERQCKAYTNMFLMRISQALSTIGCKYYVYRPIQMLKRDKIGTNSFYMLKYVGSIVSAKRDLTHVFSRFQVFDILEV